MEFIDYILIIVLALSTVLSLFRGFVKEAMSLAGWVIAIWVAWKFSPQLAGGLTGLIETDLVRLWAARALLMIGVLMGTGIVSWLISTALDQTGLTGTDRSIGMLFGFARGVVLVGLLLVLLEYMGFDQTAWWKGSKLIPYAAPVTGMLRDAAEQGMEYLDDIGPAVGGLTQP